MRTRRWVCRTFLSGQKEQRLFKISWIVGGNGGSIPLSPKYFAHIALPKAISRRISGPHKVLSFAKDFHALLTTEHVSRSLIAKKENISNLMSLRSVSIRFGPVTMWVAFTACSLLLPNDII